MIESVIHSRRNGPLIAAVAKLWIDPEDVVLDVTYGRGRFWTDFTPGTLLTHDIALDGVDFRKLPEADNSVDVVAFDPPYVSTGGRRTSTIPDFNDRYGLTDAPKSPLETSQLMAEGIAECARVLKRGGRLLVKVSDYISSGKYHIGQHYALSAGLAEGLEVADCFIHYSGTGPQPTENLDGTPRKQVHSRRAHSFLIVFKKR